MPRQEQKQKGGHNLGRAFVRALVALLLLPFCWALTVSLFGMLQPETPEAATLSFSLDTWALVCGFILWIAIHFFLPVSAKPYILGHELTHALLALLSGVKVGKIKINENGGYVMLERTNALIGLAPYFFPFYAIIAIIAWWILCFFVDPGPWRALWLFIMGMAWGHHVSYTVVSLSIRQPDIIENGHLFSYVLIYAFNVFGVCLWVIATTPATAAEFFPDLGNQSIDAYLWTFDAISAGIDWLVAKARRLF